MYSTVCSPGAPGLRRPARHPRPWEEAACPGLVNSTDGYPSATIWDEASALLATFSAYRLGILPRARYDALISQALSSLARLPLYEGVLPNKAYNTAVGSFEQTLLPGARKLSELGAKGAKELAEPGATETTPRDVLKRA